jgi:hypothetical protein
MNPPFSYQTIGSQLAPRWLNITGAGLISGLYGYVSAACVTEFVHRMDAAQGATFATLLPLLILSGIFVHLTAQWMLVSAACPRPVRLLLQTGSLFSGYASFLLMT